MKQPNTEQLVQLAIRHKAAADALKLLLAYEAAELSEQQVATAFQMKIVEVRELRLGAIEDGLALFRELTKR